MAPVGGRDLGLVSLCSIYTVCYEKSNKYRQYLIIQILTFKKFDSNKFKQFKDIFILLEMVTITFIYKIKNVNKTFYGKYIADNMSDDHEGLDVEMNSILLGYINEYRESKNLKKLKNKNLSVGVLSCITNDNYLDYYSSGEIKCFDFYYQKFKDTQVYINGKKIT